MEKTNLEKTKHQSSEAAMLFILIVVQLALVFLMQMRTIVNSDGIFSYTLANNPYAYVFIDGMYNEFPQNNGWLSAHILRENYVVEEYDRFNYEGVYHHQRYDVHPPLYYFLVHTISSFFVGQYSVFHTLAINLVALLIIDILLVQLFQELYGKKGYGLVPFVLLSSLDVMLFLFTWSRMYMLLFMFCFWYLLIHWKLIKNRECWKKTYLVQMVLCIFLGTMTHYYFYVYAACLTLFAMFFFIYEKRKYAVLNYIYAGVVGIMASWIAFPWVVAHIFGNAQGKHADITPWSLEKVGSYVEFCNEQLFNGRMWIAILILALLCLEGGQRQNSGNVGKEISLSDKRIFKVMVFGSGIFYSLIIYTLDGGTQYYSTPFYMTFIIWFSMILIDLISKKKFFLRKDISIIVMAVICVVVITSASVGQRCIANAIEVVNAAMNHTSLKSSFYRVSEDYSQYDCIFIEQEQNGLLQNLWFEFGEYDEFKKIAVADFNQCGIDKSILKGRKTKEGGILVYAPVSCVLYEEHYRLIAEGSTYHIYEIINEAEW
ncbi:MAG: hypothetical protein K2J04_10875 [Lachnospiraceae bacterium]|nr:hypothetical protein [Lachnospiraceae bacterium]